MRFNGTLQTWNESRGFGFIRPEGGGQDIFVHVSALPVPRPQPLEVLSFEVALNAEGKKKAIHVRRQAVESAGLAADQRRAVPRPRPPAPERRARDRRSPFASFVIAVLIVAGLGSYGWKEFQKQRPGQPVIQPAAAVAAPGEPAFRCDGRTHCSQMTSCGEATFFLKNCPGVQMDGNNDGVPCEQQWCR